MEEYSNKHEVFIEETFNASIERVFNAWTDPQKLMKWYAPNGCTIHFKKIKIETGGQFHSCISNPQYDKRFHNNWQKNGSISKLVANVRQHASIAHPKLINERGNHICCFSSFYFCIV